MPTKLVKPGLEIYNGDISKVHAYDDCFSNCANKASHMACDPVCTQIPGLEIEEVTHTYTDIYYVEFSS
jgi:hypothetical protein